MISTKVKETEESTSHPNINPQLRGLNDFSVHLDGKILDWLHYTEMTSSILKLLSMTAVKRILTITELKQTTPLTLYYFILS